MPLKMSSEITSQQATEDPYALRIFFQGKFCGVVLPGEHLVGALSNDGFHILFVVDNLSYQELLTISMFDRSWKRVDTADVRGPMNLGNFEDLAVVSESKASFKFLEDIPWTLEVYSKPRFRLPIFSDGLGVSRTWGWTRLFRIRRPSGRLAFFHILNKK